MKIERFCIRQSACKALINNEKPSVCTQLSEAKEKEMQKSISVLGNMFIIITLLGRWVLTLRGDGNDENSNLLKILQMRAEDVSELSD